MDRFCSLLSLSLSSLLMQGLSAGWSSVLSLAEARLVLTVSWMVSTSLSPA